jgi:hypothetical protein
VKNEKIGGAGRVVSERDFALDGEVRMRHKKLEDLAIIIAAGLLFWAILFFVALPALDQEDAARAKRVTEITKGAGK